MADKTYEIEVKTTSDTSGITSVQDVLKETQDEANATRDALTEAFEEATKEVEELEEALAEAELNGDDIEADRIADELYYAREKAEELEEQLNNFDSSGVENVTSSVQDYTDSTENATSSTEQLGVTIASIDPAVIDQLREGMQEYSTTAQDSADSTNDLMEGLVSGGMATGLGNTFMGLASKAGDYNDSMLRMGLALEGHAMTVEEVSAKYGASVSKMAEETGRGGGSVRNHFSNMAVAGVKSTEILESSFQAVANGSFYSGESIESLSNKFQRISMTGMLSAKQLSSLGLTMEDLAQVMGVSADEVSSKFKEMSAEQRASVMATASSQKYGTEVNDVFKNSWEGLWVQLDKASAGFQRLVGELLLPYLIPAVKTAVQIVDGLTEAFKIMPQPVKDIMGGFMVFGTAISTVGLGLNAVMKLGGMIISPFKSIAKLMGIENVEQAKKFARTLKSDLVGGFRKVSTEASKLATRMKTTVINAFRSVSNFFKTQFIPTLRTVGTKLLEVGKNALISGYNALKSAVMWAVDKASKLASAVANGIAEASQWALNLAMSMNPIMLVVIAIGLLIGALAYLYFNNEQVRGAIDWLGQSLYNIGTIIYGYLQQAWDFLITTLQNVWNYITTLGGLLPANVSITGNQIIDTVIRVLIFIATLPVQLGIIFVNVIAKVLGFGNNFAQRMIQGATNTVNGFINKIRELPGMIQSEFARIESIVSNFITSLPQRVWDLGASIVNALKSALGIGSPGFMYYMFEGELNRIKNAPAQLSYGITKSVGQLGKDITEEFNPKLSIQTAEVMNSQLSVGSSDMLPSQINNFYFNDTVVDSEDRMEKICEYITKKLTWNNKTAGRTV